MQRSSVDLPEPDDPMRQTTSCSATVEVDAAQDLEVAERLVQALDPEGALRRTSIRRVPPGARPRARSRATSQSVNRASGIVTTMKTGRRRCTA